MRGAFRVHLPALFQDITREALFTLMIIKKDYATIPPQRPMGLLRPNMHCECGEGCVELCYTLDKLVATVHMQIVYKYKNKCCGTKGKEGHIIVFSCSTDSGVLFD